MPIALPSSKEYETFESDTYTAVLIGWSLGADRPADAYHKTKYSQLCLDWELQIPGRDDDDEPARIRTWATLVAPPMDDRSNLYKLLTALGESTEDEEIDPDSWKGRPIRLVIQEIVKSNGNAGNKVTNYLAPKREAAAKGGKKAAAVAAPARKAAPVVTVENDEDIPF